MKPLKTVKAAKPRRNQMPIEEVRRQSILCLNLLSDLSQNERERVLKKALELNEV